MTKTEARIEEIKNCWIETKSCTDSDVPYLLSLVEKYHSLIESTLNTCRKIEFGSMFTPEAEARALKENIIKALADEGENESLR